MLLLSFISVVCARTAPEIALDLFQNCDFPEELSEAFDAEVVLSDNAVGRSRLDQYNGFCMKVIRSQ